MRLEYYYDEDRLRNSGQADAHQEARRLLSLLEHDPRIAGVIVRTHDEAYPTEDTKQQLLSALERFSVRHHVGLARTFGSRRHGFWYLPSQFLLVYNDGDLQEVFPCRIGDNEVEVLEFLERVVSQEAWTVHSVRYREAGKHHELVTELVADPHQLEGGLILIGTNVQVSRDFGERGYVDLMFQDSAGSYLLVEVKVTPQEIDKAIGQILKHRELFAEQNNLDKRRVRLAIACPEIPTHYQAICEELGINWYQIPSTR